MKPTPLAKVDAICLACGEGHGFDIVKLPGGGPWGARCKGCGSLNDPVGLGFHLDDVVDWSPYEERYVAKQREKSRAEVLAEQLKSGKVKRSPERAPSYAFPGNGLKARRTKLDLKQAVVASECEVDAGVLSSIERGSDPRLSSALRLAAFYGCSVEELFGRATLRAAEEVSLNETPTGAGAEAASSPFDGEPITNGGAEEAL